MKTDTYTKVVLTIIAIVLTANLIKGSVTPAKADTKAFATVPLNPDGSINVKILKSSTIDVNLETIDRMAFYYVAPLEVKIK